ncbi:phosphatidylglycerophosphate synthase [Marinobacter pelagius]|uniref:Phosphatidylglycerophosphate synthase n=1 Tax=Marinobacter pelagius TaxID=379482 RepID=A0A366GKK3_9GAMM|nr:CDP-alcohol phosphatidyltransferase family protein [Marinobacter pelagius]RBP27806.1 phosphatidylglycerophosphate synthase [Marinobacter pelagius]
MDSCPQSRQNPIPLWLDLTLGMAVTLVLAMAAASLVSLPGSAVAIAVVLQGAISALVVRYWPTQEDFGWANRATLLRATLVVVLLALIPWLDQLGNWLWGYAVMALLALVLDGVDGKLARVTGNNTAFGARFDMELDALFILGLSLAVLVLGKAGPWVLALGLMRYAFVAASWFWPWLNAPLPESFRRKTVCVWQIVTLMVALLPPVPDGFATLTLATALVLLGWSFLVDIRGLYQRRYSYE